MDFACVRTWHGAAQSVPYTSSPSPYFKEKTIITTTDLA